jgi:hypothetical protein
LEYPFIHVSLNRPYRATASRATVRALERSATCSGDQSKSTDRWYEVEAVWLLASAVIGRWANVYKSDTSWSNSASELSNGNQNQSPQPSRRT